MSGSAPLPNNPSSGNQSAHVSLTIAVDDNADTPPAV